MDVKTYIWIEDDKYSWVPGKITDNSEGQYKVEIEIDGDIESRYVPTSATYSEVHPSCLKGVDDLLMLGDFNQQALLHNTRQRFSNDKIYSFIGMPILIAVNPYKGLDIYNDKTIKYFKDYFNKLKNDPKEAGPAIPHLYYLSEAAYRDMINDKKNQSIIISGESGSGKTESTKIILKYLAVSSLSAAGEQKKNDKGEVITVEKQVLDSNPLLEAFGNAKTLKNNNSSRFGKFIQVSFTENGKILSARIYNYLLEKSRVVNIQKEERNYHIFYQLLLGADAQERTTYRIPEDDPLEYFEFLNQGSFTNDDTNDAKDFTITKNCMRNCDFNQNEINYILSILMGILYLGNVQFEETIENNNSKAIISEDKREDLINAAHFLGLPLQTLTDILTTRKLVDPMTKKALVRYLGVDRAYNARDAIAKALYAKMFDFIVAKVNRAIANKEVSTKYDKNKIKKIGLLDIFGFENFETNSFEQLCINYANERLQQYFNNHIFKLEQEEYSKEGISWSKINFLDNNDIISLIDGNQLSIFSLLDSEGITPNANDKSFRNNVYKHCKKSEALGDNTDNDDNIIVINHFAGVIEYVVNGFVEKNLDQLTSDITEALSLSSNSLIKKVFENKEDSKSKGKKTGSSNASSSSSKPNRLQSDTLSRQFKMQLDELLTMLSQSNPRYVKCIKPNSLKKPQVLDSLDVMDQLLCAGVLEAIKIRKKGYSIRRTKEEFYKFYRQLTPQVDIKTCKDINEAIMKMLNMLKTIPEIEEAIRPNVQKLQIGHTKVFMKEEIKIILDYKMNRIKYIYLIQSCVRAMRVRKRVRKILNGVRLIQAVHRGRIIKKFYSYARIQVKKLQKSIRHYRIKAKVHRWIKKLEMNRMMKRKEEEERIRKLHREDYVKEEVSVINKGSSALIEAQVNANTSINNNHHLLKGSAVVPKVKKSLKHNTEDVNSKAKDGKETKPSKKTKKNNAQQNLFDFSMQNVVDEELKKKVDSLQKELDASKLENEVLKTQNESLKQELTEVKEKLSIEISSSSGLTSNTNITSASPSTLTSSSELKSLKQSLTEKDSSIEILTMQLDQLTKSNKSLTEQFDTFKSQTTKRKDKYDKELNSLYQQIQELELAKQEYERRLTQETKQERDSHALINLNTNQRTISELKTENKSLQKKFDDLKLKHSKELAGIKSDLAVKEYQLKTSTDIPEDYKALKKENELCKEKLSEMKVKMDNMSKLSKLNDTTSIDIEKKKNEYELKLHQKDLELITIREEADRHKAQADKMKRMDTVLRTELEEKERKMIEYVKEIEDLREENEKMTDDIMVLKRDNNNMKTKIGLFDAQAKARSDNEIKVYVKQIETYKKQLSEQESNIAVLESSIDKKQSVLDNVKKMNLLLIELAKIKKSEVGFIDGLKRTNSSQLKEALESLREKEAVILAQLGEVSKEHVESEDDEDDDDDDEDGEDDEEGDGDEEEEGDEDD